MTRQRLERVLDEAFVSDLDALSTDELRARRAEAEAEEEAVSYVRRLLQGRLDILRAELVRRNQDGNDQAADLLSRLSGVLADDRGAAARDVLQSRATRLRVPDGIEEHTARLDALVDASALAELEGRTIDTLQTFVIRLTDHERELSSLRRQLFDRVDALRAELAARYKDGRAAIGDLLTER